STSRRLMRSGDRKRERLVRAAKHMHVVGTQSAVEHLQLRAAGIDETTCVVRRSKAERTHEAAKQRDARHSRKRLQYSACNRSDASGGSMYVLRSLLLSKYFEASQLGVR